MLLFIVSPSVSYAASEVGTCRPAKTKRDAKHLYFSIDEGKKLWQELKLLRLDKKKLQLIDTKLELKDEQIQLWKIQFNAAEKTVVSQEKRHVQLNLKISDLTKENTSLKDQNNKLTIDAAKYKGQRYEFLIWGVVGGFVLTAVVVGAIGIAVVSAK